MDMRTLAAAALLVLLGAGCRASAPPMPETPPGADATNVSASKTLDMSGKGLASLPASVLGRTELETLDISANRIVGALPAEIGRLRNLRTLDASGNRMTGVPAEVGQLSALRFLDLSDNELTGLPHELANLKNLETLDLRGNDVSAADLAVIRAGIPQAEILID